MEGYTVFNGFYLEKESRLFASTEIFFYGLYVHIFSLTFTIKCPNSVLELDQQEQGKLSTVVASGLDKKFLTLFLSP